MNSFDLFILLPIGTGLMFGFFKGFVKEVVSLTAVIGGIFFAELFSSRFTPYVAEVFNLSDKMGKTASYVGLFLGFILMALMLSKVAEKIFRGLKLGWLNSLLGGLLGALKIAIVISVIVNVYDALDSKFNFAKQEKKEASMAYYPIMKLAPALWQEAKKTIDENRINHQNQQSETDEIIQL